MDGQTFECDGCGARIARAAPICPRCAASLPGGLKGLDSYLRAEHHNLRLAGLVLMWAWLATALTSAIAFTGLFIVRLG
jgi:hypothetical protein